MLEQGPSPRKLDRPSVNEASTSYFVDYEDHFWVFQGTFRRRAERAS